MAVKKKKSATKKKTAASKKTAKAKSVTKKKTAAKKKTATKKKTAAKKTAAKKSVKKAGTKAKAKTATKKKTAGKAKKASKKSATTKAKSAKKTTATKKKAAPKAAAKPAAPKSKPAGPKPKTAVSKPKAPAPRKKTPAPAPEVAEEVVKEPPPRNLDPIIQKIRSQLIQQRNELMSMIKSSQEVERNIGELTFSNEIDLASSLEGREMAFQLSSRERNELKLIEEALFKMAKGTYGVCEGCQKNIPVKRLQIMPLTPLCIECQENLEVS